MNQVNNNATYLRSVDVQAEWHSIVKNNIALKIAQRTTHNSTSANYQLRIRYRNPLFIKQSQHRQA